MNPFADFSWFFPCALIVVMFVCFLNSHCALSTRLSKTTDVLFVAALIGVIAWICLLPAPAHAQANSTVQESDITADCETIQPGIRPTDDGMNWELLSTYRAVRVCWEVVNLPEHTKATPQALHQSLAQRCRVSEEWNGTACVMGVLSNGACWVLSTLTLGQAKVTGVPTPTGLINGRSHVSVYNHEVYGHCMGWGHPKTPTVTSLLSGY